MATGVAQRADHRPRRLPRPPRALLGHAAARHARRSSTSAKSDPQAHRLPRGRQAKILRAAQDPGRGGDRQPILLGRASVIAPLRTKAHIDARESRSSTRDFAAARRVRRRFARAAQRSGITVADAQRCCTSRTTSAMMMVDAGDADGVIAGLTPTTRTPSVPRCRSSACAPGVRSVAGAVHDDVTRTDCSSSPTPRSTSTRRPRSSRRSRS